MSDFRDLIKWFLGHPIIASSGVLLTVITLWVAFVSEEVVSINTKLTLFVTLFVGVLIWWFGTENILNREKED